MFITPTAASTSGAVRIVPPIGYELYQCPLARLRTGPCRDAPFGLDALGGVEISLANLARIFVEIRIAVLPQAHHHEDGPARIERSADNAQPGKKINKAEQPCRDLSVSSHFPSV